MNKADACRPFCCWLTPVCPPPAWASTRVEHVAAFLFHHPELKQHRLRPFIGDTQAPHRHVHRTQIQAFIPDHAEAEAESPLPRAKVEDLEGLDMLLPQFEATGRVGDIVAAKASSVDAKRSTLAQKILVELIVNAGRAAA